MPGSPSLAILRDIQTLFDTGTAGGLSDRQLLERFIDRRDDAEAAFEVLVVRHGPMVLRVCRNVLRDPNDVQDAFQATFMVLVRRWRSIRKRDSVGGWLYGVACRVAARARVDSARRKAAEQRAALRVVEALDPDEQADEDRRDFGPIVQEEVRRLPEKHRAVVVLCYWQGLTHEQAANQLGCPLGTVRSRLARARSLLHRRLTRRGLAPLAGAVATALDTTGAKAGPIILPAVSPEMVRSTIQAAVQVALGRPIAHAVSGAAATLVKRVTWSMAMIKATGVLGGLAFVVLASTGGWLAASKGPVAQPQPKIDQKPAPAAVKEKTAGSEKVFSQVQSTVLMMVPDGTPVRKGDVICELDSAALRDQLLNQKITVLSAEANFENAKLGRENAELAVVEYEEGTFRLQSMETEGNIKIAEAELALAIAELEAARKAAVADNPANKLDVKRSELNLFRARFALEKSQARKKLLLDYNKGRKIKELRSGVEKARSSELAKKAIWELELAKMKKLEHMIACCSIKALRDGTVQNRFGIMERTAVYERQPLLEIDPPPSAKPKSP